MINKLNNKGFMYVETIITVVILLTTLVSLYSVYSKVINREKDRLYYDDPAKIYTSLAIKDILINTLDDIELKKKADSSGSYITFFDYNNTGLFHDQALFQRARDLYNIERFAFVRISEFEQLKKCVKSGTGSKCTKTKQEQLDFYGTKNLKDYILTMDLPVTTNEFKEHYGIIIVIIKEFKNGTPNLEDLPYKECLQNHVYAYNGLSSSSAASSKKQALNNYYNDNSLSFNMACETVEYITWVFL